jgi:hypothetical protein
MLEPQLSSSVRRVFWTDCACRTHLVDRAGARADPRVSEANSDSGGAPHESQPGDEATEAEYGRAKSDWEVWRAGLQAISEREACEEFTQDDRQRVARIASKTRTVMKAFLARATERKIDRLSDLITESFRYLLRKQTMVERMHIDPS